MANVKIVSLDIRDLSDKILKATAEQIELALEKCGLHAVNNAVNYCTAKSVIDTGLLKNSLTYALGGKITHIQSYSGDRPSRYKNDGKIPNGRYEGRARDDPEGRRTVYIGTNVEYAVYNELGWRHYLSGKRTPARPFLRPSLENHIVDYHRIFEETLSKLDGK